MRYGLKEHTIESISGVLVRHPAVEKAILYGSRAKGNFKHGSDIDLTLCGNELTTQELGVIIEELDELLLPYKIDLSILEQLDHAKLREHIERVGVVFYQRAVSNDGKGVKVKAGWTAKPLAEVCQIKPPKAEARRLLVGTDLVSFVPMEDLGIDLKVFSPTQQKPLDEVTGSYTYFADGDVLLAKITPCFENGKLGIAENLINGVGFGSSEYIVFRPDKSLDKEWLYYFLSQESFRKENAEHMSGAVGHKRVSKEFIESYPIPVPPLPEQQRIVGILDEAFDGIATAKANAENNLQNARALFESQLNDVFTQRGEGWVEKPLSGFAQSVSTGPFGSLLHKSDYVSDGVPLVNPINIVNGSIVPDANKMIDPATKQRLQSYVLQQGDIVVGRRGEIGRCAVVEAEQAGWVCGTGCFFIRPLQSVNPYFLANLIRSSNYREQLERASSGATMLNLSNKALGELPVAIPNLLVQNHMLAQLEKLSEETQRLASIYQQKLAALESLKKSMLDQAFSGGM